jgi:hypothetical protein
MNTIHHQHPSGQGVKHASRPEVSSDDLEAFLQNYLAVANRCKPADILAFYANSVDYFDVGTVTKEFIFQDKDRYCQHWKEVHYELSGPVAVANAGFGSDKQLTFETSFFARSPERNASALGKALNVLTIRAIDGAWKIIAEKQTITERKSLP